MRFVTLIIFFILNKIYCQPEGWRMVDRFYGFRYEIIGQNILEIGFEEAVKEEADKLGCFGWIQKSEKKTLVGEVRCNKIQGPKLQEWISHGPQGAIISKVDFKIYSDTKIRLHFSSFKILEEKRETCFLDQPHQCQEFAPNTILKGHTEL